MCLRTNGIWAFFQDDMWKRYLWVKIRKNLRYNTKNFKVLEQNPKEQSSSSEDTRLFLERGQDGSVPV